MDGVPMGVDFDTNIVVAFDFDGTITKKDNYPYLDYEYNSYAIKWIKRIQKLNIISVLWTCNNEQKIEKITNELAEKYSIYFDYINDYPYRGNSRKLNADIYIDDRANSGLFCWPVLYYRVKFLIRKRKKGYNDVRKQ